MSSIMRFSGSPCGVKKDTHKGVYEFEDPWPGCLTMGYASEVCFGVCFP